MEMLKWAFMRCWPLGSSCEVNWDAWAAMGTMAGVLTALAAPWIRDWSLRRKANAVFGLAYKKALRHVSVRLSRYQDQFPVKLAENADPLTGKVIGLNQAELKQFVELADILRVASERELDVSRWPAVSQELAYSVALALYALHQFIVIVDLVSRCGDDKELWQRSWRVYGLTLDAAINEVTLAEAKCSKAVERIGGR